jgi:hypothetical protein
MDSVYAAWRAASQIVEPGSLDTLETPLAVDTQLDQEYIAEPIYTGKDIDTSEKGVPIHPFLLGSSWATDSGLEAGVVHAAVHLVTALIPTMEPSVRAQCATLLLQLAECLAPESWKPPSQSQLGLLLIQISGSEPLIGVATLFDLISSSLGTLVVALVAGLSWYLTDIDAAVRTTCVLGLTKLVLTNSNKFEVADGHALIWNLYFALSSSSITQPFPNFGQTQSGVQGSNATDPTNQSRSIFIHALGDLHELYASHTELLLRIVEVLFRLEFKVRISCIFGLQFILFLQ